MTAWTSGRTRSARSSASTTSSGPRAKGCCGCTGRTARGGADVSCRPSSWAARTTTTTGGAGRPTPRARA
eukprot:5238454-Lingulodinium_polyedra.AAC.1